MLAELVLKNRSYRRFYQKHSVDLETLKDLVNLARLTASGGNVQPLKYILACDPQMNALIFPHLTWAAFLKDWPGPDDGERPSAYIIILGDSAISQSFGCDHGIAAQTILLGASERGLGGCIIGTIHREKKGYITFLSDPWRTLLSVNRRHFDYPFSAQSLRLKASNQIRPMKSIGI
ncbi:MAG: nitroreductase family protein [Syntrophobacteraceae bacterium]